jgi:hypothetical protein
MKTTVGVLAVLLLVSTLAIGQQYQPLPFPQEANTALAGSPADETSPSLVDADRPASMASDQAIPLAFSDRQDNPALGSPFPSAANPSQGSSSEDQMAPSFDEHNSLGSPFPGAANPSRE